ncbi:MAG: hypothetical protein Q7J29_13025 [Stagnimonas sp.]|nr:hypothetical protein [Stagnimonas sp.]
MSLNAKFFAPLACLLPLISNRNQLKQPAKNDASVILLKRKSSSCCFCSFFIKVFYIDSIGLHIYTALQQKSESKKPGQRVTFPGFVMISSRKALCLSSTYPLPNRRGFFLALMQRRDCAPEKQAITSGCAPFYSINCTDLIDFFEMLRCTTKKPLESGFFVAKISRQI